MIQQVTNHSLNIPLNVLFEWSDGMINVKKGTYLFQDGMEAQDLFCVQSGLIQIAKATFDGREIALRLCKRGDLIGEFSIFSNYPKYMFNAQAVEDSSLFFIKKERLQYELFQNPKLGMEFMKWMSDQFQITQTKFRDLILHGKKGALYSTLIRMANSYGEKIENGTLINLEMTHQELANFCGTTRESINRMLSTLRKTGIISYKDKKIVVHDLQYLKNEINCDDCPVSYCCMD